MDIPKNVPVHEHAIASFWFDESGILHSVSKPGSRTMEVMTEYVEYLKTICNNKKVCILTDITKATPLDKKTRKYMEHELKKRFIAMAIISNAPVGKMIGNVFLTANQPNFPTRMFLNEKDARDWLMSYINKKK